MAHARLTLAVIVVIVILLVGVKSLEGADSTTINCMQEVAEGLSTSLTCNIIGSGKIVKWHRGKKAVIWCMVEKKTCRILSKKKSRYTARFDSSNEITVTINAFDPKVDAVSWSCVFKGSRPSNGNTCLMKSLETTAKATTTADYGPEEEEETADYGPEEEEETTEVSIPIMAGPIMAGPGPQETTQVQATTTKEERTPTIEETTSTIEETTTTQKETTTTTTQEKPTTTQKTTTTTEKKKPTPQKTSPKPKAQKTTPKPRRTPKAPETTGKVTTVPTTAERLTTQETIVKTSLKTREKPKTEFKFKTATTMIECLDEALDGVMTRLTCTIEGKVQNGITWYRPNNGVKELVVSCDRDGSRCQSIGHDYPYSARYESAAQVTLTVLTFWPLTDAGLWGCYDGEPNDDPHSQCHKVVMIGDLAAQSAAPGMLTNGSIMMQMIIIFSVMIISKSRFFAVF